MFMRVGALEYLGRNCAKKMVSQSIQFAPQPAFVLCSSWACRFFQEIQIGTIGFAGVAGQANLTRPAAGVAARVLVRLDLGCLAGRGGGRQLRKHESAVAGKSTASSARWNEDFSAALARDGFKLCS